MANSYTKLIRAKKLGVLIRDARQKAKREPIECGKAIHTSPETFEKFEQGEQSPSLPELELLSSFLKVPLDHFWGSQVLSEQPSFPNDEKMDYYLLLRNRMIGVMIKQARLSAGLSVEEVAERANLTESQLQSYELGEQPIPLPELEIITDIVKLPIKDLFDVRGSKLSQPQVLEYFAELPIELREFILKPINRPYLELAHRLSEMSVEKLRAVAEGLLEITL
jgi:transcriptional regulator with XRE-family HTH domain